MIIKRLPQLQASFAHATTFKAKRPGSLPIIMGKVMDYVLPKPIMSTMPGLDQIWFIPEGTSKICCHLNKLGAL
jgi:hypothetical protein